MPAPRSSLLAPCSLLAAPRLALLRSYFTSGWAFLIPYLGVYLLYYVTKWPVNASRLMENGEVRMQNGWVPCMLHLYWALHAIHVILAGFALWSWLHGRAKDQEPSIKCQNLTAPVSLSYSLPATRSSLLAALAPWALLALIFYIPGVYLEWPSDPWEHLRRINEWRILDTVGAHSSWYKSAYFIPYSLLSWCIGLRQLFWLDFYYTGICLLLCWQYYKFSRACGLGERSSMVFVIIQALLFGNNIFSFYRYYGISSSIYAQLGAVALTRIVLEFAARGTKLEAAGKTTETGSCITEGDELGHRGHRDQSLLSKKRNGESLIGQEGEDATVQSVTIRDNQWLKKLRSLFAPLSSVQTTQQKTGSENLTTDHIDKPGSQSPSLPTPSSPPPAPRSPLLAATPLAPGAASVYSLLTTRYSLLISVPALIALTALNHAQGLGIAGLGIAAIIVWRLIEWKRSALWWLIGGTLVINALFLAFYHRPAIIETYRAQGYLNAWYGFNILDLTSPAGDRMLQIITSFGLLNLSISILHFRQNHVITWITIVPLVVLLTPSVSIPFANQLSTHGEANTIITFQRMLFSIPTGLAIILYTRFSSNNANTSLRSILLISLGAILYTPIFNKYSPRAWHSLTSIPNDLTMVYNLPEKNLPQNSKSKQPKLITTYPTGAMLQSIGAQKTVYAWRTIGAEPNNNLIKPILVAIAENQNNDHQLYIQSILKLHSSTSFSGLLSTHWLPQEAALDLSAGSELCLAGNNAGMIRDFTCNGIFYTPTSKRR